VVGSEPPRPCLPRPEGCVRQAPEPSRRPVVRAFEGTGRIDAPLAKGYQPVGTAIFKGALGDRQPDTTGSTRPPQPTKATRRPLKRERRPWWVTGRNKAGLDTGKLLRLPATGLALNPSAGEEHLLTSGQRPEVIGHDGLQGLSTASRILPISGRITSAQWCIEASTPSSRVASIACSRAGHSASRSG